MNALSLLESIHGHLAILATAALFHPALLLRTGRPLSRGARWSVGLSAALTFAAFGLGLTIYEPYRKRLRRSLFLQDPAAGWLFETKEHLAYAAIALTLGAAVCAFAAPPREPRLRQLSAAVFAAAAITCAVVVALGTYLASVRSFAGGL